MRYYLTRDGQTYGPYPAESIPGMVQAGNMVPEDLVCPEGGTDWVALKTVPGLLTGASAAAPTSAGLRVRATESAPAAAPSDKFSLPGSSSSEEEKPGLAERAGNMWGTLKLIIYGVVALVILIGVVGAMLASQRDKKEIAKLQTQPGWKAFNAGNSQINSESVNAGFGNTSQAEQAAKTLSKALEAADKELFTMETPRYRGRSKLGRVASAVDAATAGKGHFETFVELRADRALVLVHVPEYDRYKKESRDAARLMCAALSSAVIQRNLANTKTPDMTLVVGVRGKSDYDCAFVGPVGKLSKDEPKPTITGNAATHKLLVQWFGETKP
jgi:hypothetical protein